MHAKSSSSSDFEGFDGINEERQRDSFNEFLNRYCNASLHTTNEVPLTTREIEQDDAPQEQINFAANISINASSEESFDDSTDNTSIDTTSLGMEDQQQHSAESFDNTSIDTTSLDDTIGIENQQQHANDVVGRNLCTNKSVSFFR